MLNHHYISYTLNLSVLYLILSVILEGSALLLKLFMPSAAGATQQKLHSKWIPSLKKLIFMKVNYQYSCQLLLITTAEHTNMQVHYIWLFLVPAPSSSANVAAVYGAMSNSRGNSKQSLNFTAISLQGRCKHDTSCILSIRKVGRQRGDTNESSFQLHFEPDSLTFPSHNQIS